MELFQNEVRTAAEIIKKCYCDKKIVLACGNGGSAADCEHIVGELVKEFKTFRPLTPQQKQKLGELGEKLRGGIAAVSLVSQCALLTAESNDVGYEYSFAQQVSAYKDVAGAIICLSTSGNSKAVCNAAAAARAFGITVIGFTGKDGGKLKALCDVCFNAPETETYKIQEIHLPLYHRVCALAEELIWKKQL